MEAKNQTVEQGAFCCCLFAVHVCVCAELRQLRQRQPRSRPVGSEEPLTPTDLTAEPAAASTKVRLDLWPGLDNCVFRPRALQNFVHGSWCCCQLFLPLSATYWPSNKYPIHPPTSASMRNCWRQTEVLVFGVSNFGMDTSNDDSICLTAAEFEAIRKLKIEKDELERSKGIRTP